MTGDRTGNDSTGNDRTDNDMVHAIAHQGSGATARTVIILRNGNCVAIGAALVRFARDLAALDDPLGNGVRGVLEIPPALSPGWLPESGFLVEQSGGAIILNGGATLLLKPFAIELYASGLDALHGRDCRGRIDLAAH